MGAIDRELVDQLARGLGASPESAEALLKQRRVLVRVSIEWDNGAVEIEHPYTVAATDLLASLAQLVDGAATNLDAEIKEDRGRAGPPG